MANVGLCERVYILRDGEYVPVGFVTDRFHTRVVQDYKVVYLHLEGFAVTVAAEVGEIDRCVEPLRLERTTS